MKKLMLVALLVLGALAAYGEPGFKSLAVTATAGSYTFPDSTRVVTIVSDGAGTCYFRLFNNRDTAADATAAEPSSPIKTGESLSYSLKASSDTNPDSQGSASMWRSMSAICAAGQTATLRVYSK